MFLINIVLGIWIRAALKCCHTTCDEHNPIDGWEPASRRKLSG